MLVLYQLVSKVRNNKICHRVMVNSVTLEQSFKREYGEAMKTYTIG